MKPIPVTTAVHSRRDLFAGRERQRMPVTDYRYHSLAFEGFRGRYLRNPRQSFSNIVGNYLKNEARHDFWSEAALFAVITVTAALPLMNNLHALIQLVRAITPH